MTYVPADDAYERMQYRRNGRSGLRLPPISLGLWQNFGGEAPLERSRAILRRAFDLGITHFDLANNFETHEYRLRVVHIVPVPKIEVRNAQHRWARSPSKCAPPS